MVEHFSSNIQNIIQSELFRAQKSIKIAVSWFTNDLLFQPLLLKKNIGVEIELILNHDEINCGISNPINFDELSKIGGKIYWNTSKNLMHDKFCIIDDNIVITGSYNWTNKAEFNKENISVFRGELDTLRFYNEQFKKYIHLYGNGLINQSVFTETGNVYSCNSNVSVCKQYPFNQLNFVKGNYCIFSEKGNSIIVVSNYNEKHKISILDNNTLKPILPFENDDRSHPNLEHKTIWLWKNHRAALYSVERRAYLTNHMFDSVTPGLGKGLFVVHFNNHFGVYDVTGKFILPCEYDSIELDYPNTGVIRKGWKFGLLSNGISLDCIYDEINLQGRPSRIGNKYGLLSDGFLRDCNKNFAKTGIVILPFEYDEIFKHDYFNYDMGSFYVMRQGNSYGFYLPCTGHVEPCIHIPIKDEDMYKECLFRRVTQKLYNQTK